MKLLFIFIYTTLILNANEYLLSSKEQEKLCTETFKQTWGIKYHVDRVYSYRDKLAKHLLIFSSVKDINSVKVVKIYKLIQLGNSLSLDWTFSDRILAHKGEEELKILYDEISLKDINKDGFIDPIFTILARSNRDVMRVTLALFHQSRKHLIKHHNKSKNHKAYTWIDDRFYTLDKKALEVVKHRVSTLEKIAIIRGYKAKQSLQP
jgi:hypothetical protein